MYEVREISNPKINNYNSIQFTESGGFLVSDYYNDNGKLHTFMIKTSPFFNSTDLLINSLLTTYELDIGGAYQVESNVYDFDETDYQNFINNQNSPWKQ